jgi:uncharacterized protein (TIGR03435 family)
VPGANLLQVFLVQNGVPGTRIGFLIVGILVAVIDSDRLTIATSAQEPDPDEFEVASIKPNLSGEVSWSIYPLAGRTFSAENAPLRDLIRYAYQISDFELVDAPDWTERERFDIRAIAKADIAPAVDSGPAAERVMLRALLADRFKLAIRRDIREMPIYALVLARSDGQVGPQLHVTQTNCAELKKAAGGLMPPAADGSVRCNLRNSGTGLMTANALPMQTFARFLSGQVQRVVVDRTGLTGDWDFQLKFTPDRMRDAAGGSPPTEAPTLFTALQEQLGLKLESTRGSVELKVVEWVERPTPD